MRFSWLALTHAKEERNRSSYVNGFWFSPAAVVCSFRTMDLFVRWMVPAAEHPPPLFVHLPLMFFRKQPWGIVERMNEQFINLFIHSFIHSIAHSSTCLVIYTLGRLVVCLQPAVVSHSVSQSVSERESCHEKCTWNCILELAKSSMPVCLLFYFSNRYLYNFFFSFLSFFCFLL